MYFFQLSIVSSEKQVIDDSHYGSLSQMEIYNIVDVNKINI